MEGVMPSLNTAARNFMVEAAADIAPTGTLQILAGATVLASHTLADSGAASSGVVTANAIADAAIAASGTATSATLSQSGRVLTLSIGTSGAEVIVPTLSYVSGGTSEITSLTITYPAS